MILVTRVRDLIQAIDACIALSYQTQKCTLFRGRNMSDVIATVWDFDKTLIPGYMQDPIFKHYGVEAAAFWKENSDEIEALQKKKLDVNKDAYYLNRFIRISQPEQPFDSLNNELLVKLGAELEFYPAPSIYSMRSHE